MNKKTILKVMTSGSMKCKIVFLSILVVISALPFLNQSVHIDDPLFIQVARNIINNPLDPYGSIMNWLGKPEKMFDFFSNPPLFSYYLAAVISIWGENESAMHFACIPFALMTGIGMFFLSRRFNAPAFASALFLVLSPIFFTMSHTLMPDVAMCGFTICGVLFFILGFDGDRLLYVILGAFLAGLAPLIRYNGLIAPVLIMFYIVLHFRKNKIKYSFSLLIPALLFAGWNVFTLNKYGAMHFLHHMYFQKYGLNDGVLIKIIHFLPHLMAIASCFLLLFLMLLWKKRNAIVALLTFGFAVILTLLIQAVTHYALVNLILVFMIAIGVSAFFIVTAVDLVEEWKSGFPRDSLFLVLWLISIIWMQNSGIHSAAKYMIAALSPVIVISLRNTGQFINRKQLVAAILFTTLIGSITAIADFHLASVYKKMANDVAEQTSQIAFQKYFNGHWGFQYYMENNYASAYPKLSVIPSPAILSCVALANPQEIHHESEMNMEIVFQKTYDDNFPFRTMSNSLGFQANFYSYVNYLSNKGPVRRVYGVLPFSISRAPLETLTVYELK
jgi:4-amino-4-deoxy-L-arabinose transferase-like glycosyltransferase